MNFKKTISAAVIAASVLALFSGCAKESSRVVQTPTVASLNTNYSGERIAVSVGRFNNQSSYNNGVFSDGEDRLGNQAQTILISNLQQTGRFSVLDRTNMRAIKEESAISKSAQNLKGARYVITGDVTEFGRKTTGDHQLFGILGKGKTQTAYSKVNLNVVDVKTSEVVFSTQGAGEYELSNREVLGFGGTAGYDSTLNGKVLSLAIIEAVNNLVNGLENGAFKLR
ncbi:CsgG/HfaB family protein [uncultured Campylobacter sp.]|uniref:CsgG/HfaB family protein n=1 Tax=uncultured Campylobacter sp. TaxID=218934 RepID=UPI0026051A5E|nr:CsgG/HfaB family protein [uncultured Campylobacter sp.]